ncbi:MAG: DsbA family protein [Alphaproteobacteria bacterium]|nr:DsbA family protein [Alphaproteobacteria bacterium]
MKKLIDFYWSFRSPYCYLAMPRAKGLRDEYGVEFRMRVIYPLAVRFPDFFVDAPPQRISYPRLDRARVAEFLGLPFADPDPDPLVLGPDKRPVDNQPYIHRLTRLGIDASRQDKGFEFCDCVSEIIWSGRVSSWPSGNHLKGAAAAAGLDLADMDRRIEANAHDFDREAAANFADLSAAGHWGVPTFVLDGEPFFGQDRLNILEWRLNA